MPSLVARVIALVLLLLPASVALRAESTDTWVRGIFTGNSPRPVAVETGNAWKEATALAAKLDNCTLLRGSGQSMQPLYPLGTVLVVQEVPYENLQRGQTAIYRRQDKRIIAHVLVAKARDGWRAAGLNNQSHDLEAVKAKNLVGVVVAAFSPAPADVKAIAASPKRHVVYLQQGN